MQQVIKNIFSLILIISICEAGLLLPAIAHGDGTLYIKLDDEKDAKARIKKRKKEARKASANKEEVNEETPDDDSGDDTQLRESSQKEVDE